MNNNFESPKPESAENAFEEYDALIAHHEAIKAQEELEEKVPCGIHIEEFEKMLAPLLEETLLANLNAIKTEQEALGSAERESAEKALRPLGIKMRFLAKRTDITAEKYEELHKKYIIISRAVGIKNRTHRDPNKKDGVVDHNR